MSSALLLASGSLLINQSLSSPEGIKAMGIINVVFGSLSGIGTLLFCLICSGELDTARRSSE